MRRTNSIPPRHGALGQKSHFDESQGHYSGDGGAVSLKKAFQQTDRPALRAPEWVPLRRAVEKILGLFQA